MSCMHLSYTAMTGKPVVRDIVTKAIISGSDLGMFADIGCFQEHHLRILVTLPRTPLYVIKMVAREPGTHPEKAIDYCSSAAMARALIKICGDVTCFSFYNQQSFVDGAALHDFRKGADRFRRREVVYEVLCERVLYGGDVLPPHVARWFTNYGSNMLYAYMFKRGSAHMLACYGVCERQAFERTEEVVAPVSYAFLIAYHRYTKYLPITMFVRAMTKKKAVMTEAVRKMANEGYSCAQIESFVGGEEMREMAELRKSAVHKKKRRKLARVTKSFSAKQLYEVVQRIVGLGCCEKHILSFL